MSAPRAAFFEPKANPMSDLSPSTGAVRAHDGYMIGVAFMIGGALTIPLIDLFGKALGQGFFGPKDGAPLWIIGEPMGALQIGWGRFLMQALILIPITLLFVRGGLRRPKRLGLVMLRGALLAIATVAFFAALRFLPMAEAISIFFVEPLVLTVLSALFLKEKIGWRRLGAVAVGLAGALLIIRPNFLAVGWPALLPLVTAFGYALYLLLTRMLAQKESPIVLQLWSGFVGLVLISALLGAADATDMPGVEPIALTARHWLVFVGVGVVATASHVVIAAAFRYAEASALAPLQYFEIFGAALLGWLFFDERLGDTTLLGLALIIGAGVFVLRRERALKEAGERDLVHPIAPPKRE